MAPAGRRRDPHPDVSPPAPHASGGAQGRRGQSRPGRRFLSTFVLTLTNPMTFVAFAAIFATIGIGAVYRRPMPTTDLVDDMFLGSAVGGSFFAPARSRCTGTSISRAGARQRSHRRLRDRGRARLPALRHGNRGHDADPVPGAPPRPRTHGDAAVVSVVRRRGRSPTPVAPSRSHAPAIRPRPSHRLFVAPPLDRPRGSSEAARSIGLSVVREIARRRDRARARACAPESLDVDVEDRFSERRPEVPDARLLTCLAPRRPNAEGRRTRRHLSAGASARASCVRREGRSPRPAARRRRPP